MFKIILSQKENVRYIIYMKKRFLCLSLIFALAVTQVMPVAASRKEEVQTEKANTESKLSAAESKEAELEQQKEELLGEINSLDQSLVKTLAEIEAAETDVLLITGDITNHGERQSHIDFIEKIKVFVHTHSMSVADIKNVIYIIFALN